MRRYPLQLFVAMGDHPELPEDSSEDAYVTFTVSWVTPGKLTLMYCVTNQ